MVFCSLCKTNQQTLYNWQIADYGVRGKCRKYRICDKCAVILLREMTGRIMGIRDGEDMPSPMVLSKTGVISDLLLHEDNSLELVIDMDIYKARRIIPKTEEKE